MLRFLPIPTTYQRQVFIDILVTFSAVVMINAALMVVVGVIQQARELGVSIGFLLPLLPYIVLTILPFTVPAALLLAVCIVYGRCSADNEVVALKAAGISPMQALKPGIVLGVLVSLSTLLLMSRGIPWAAAVVENAILSEMDEIAMNQLRTTHFLYHKGSKVKIMVSGVEGRTLISPLFEIPTANGITVVQAATATFQMNAKEQTISIEVEDAVIELPSGDAGPPDRVIIRGKESMNFVLPSRSRPRLSYRMSTSDLDHEVLVQHSKIALVNERHGMEMMMALARADFPAMQRVSPIAKGMKEANSRIDSLLTEKHSRMSMSWSCLFFVLLGSPLAVLMGKRHYLTTFMVCFAPMICVYYPIVLGVTVQCKEGIWNPLWAMWIGNAILGITAFFLIQRLRAH